MRFFTLQCYFKRVKKSVILDSGSVTIKSNISKQKFNMNSQNFFMDLFDQ